MAAVLLVAIGAWAELAMAPMLAMHSGHMLPGHEMAADMPHHAAHHAHHSQHEQAQHEQASAGQAPCCPGFHKTQPETALTLTSGAPACDDPHSCCFRQGPQSVPAQARDAQNLTQIMPAMTAEAAPARATARLSPRDSALELSPPSDVFGMTLRI